MLFAGAELARRIERAECGLLHDYGQALARDPALGIFSIPLGGGLASFAGVDSPLTKLAGLGFASAPSDEELASVEAEFDARGAALVVELSTLAEAGLAERFSQRGYRLAGFENVLGLGLREPERWRGREDVQVEQSGDLELELWIDVLASAFAAPDTQGVTSHEAFPREVLARILRGTATARGLVRYLARRADEPAGAASIRMDDGVAQLCGAGTLPAQRRRGVQSALLETRLRDAAGAGCEVAVVTTLPGSKSQENVQKQGFELLYARAILRRPPP
jgi:ribosomal protein S18 acetylase RimI-like enzyme